MVKVLCIGDLHITRQNIQEVKLFTKKIILAIKKCKPDVCVILGDVLHHHDRIYVEAFNCAISLIKSISGRVKTFLLVGNHDMINSKQYLTTNHSFNAFKEWGESLTVVDFITSWEYKDNLFYFAPYIECGKFKKALNDYDKKEGFDKENGWKTANCIFAHQEFKGVKMLNKNSKKGDKWKEHYPNVVSGHIHNSQYLHPNIYYTGCSFENFSNVERENSTEKRIWQFNFIKDEKMTYSTINLNMPKKQILELTQKELDSIESIDDYLLSKFKKQQIPFIKILIKRESSYDKESSNYNLLLDSHNTQIEWVEKDDVLKNNIEFVNVLYENVKDNPELIDIYNQIIL